MAIELQAGRSVSTPASDKGAPSILHRKIALFEPKPGTRDRILFTDRLALQLEAGVSLHLALQSLRDQMDKDSMKAIIAGVMEVIEQGGTFSSALAQYPQLFSRAYVNLLASSENGGFMPKVLEQLRDMDEKQEKLRSMLVSALSYPVFLMMFSIAVVVFVLTVIFPKFAEMFASMDDALPGITRVLLKVSNLLTTYPLQIALALAALAAAGAVLLSRPQGRAWLDRMKLRVPLLREVYRRMYVARLMHTMGMSLEHGVTILATLGACKDIIPNAEFRAFISRLEEEVTEGKGIAAGFAGSVHIPAPVTQMIATGEQTGKLGYVMTRIAEFYDRELTKQVQTISKLAEPVMLLVMGGVVGTIVSALILPIFKMSSGMR